MNLAITYELPQPLQGNHNLKLPQGPAILSLLRTLSSLIKFYSFGKLLFAIPVRVQSFIIYCIIKTSMQLVYFSASEYDEWQNFCSLHRINRLHERLYSNLNSTIVLIGQQVCFNSTMKHKKQNK